MKTKKAKVTTNVPFSGEEKNPPSVPPEGTSADSQVAGKRVGVAWVVTDSGEVDFSHMRESTRDQLRAFVNDKKVKTMLGLDKQEDARPAPEVFPPDFCGSLYDGVGVIMCIVASRFYKLPYEDCQRVLTYSAMEKATLAGPTAAVINKYASDWMIKFKEEFALLILFGSMTLGKLTALRVVIESRPVENAQPRREPKPEPAKVVTVQAEPQAEEVAATA